VFQSPSPRAAGSVAEKFHAERGIEGVRSSILDVTVSRLASCRSQPTSLVISMSSS